MNPFPKGAGKVLFILGKNKDANQSFNILISIVENIIRILVTYFLNILEGDDNDLPSFYCDWH